MAAFAPSRIQSVLLSILLVFFVSCGSSSKKSSSSADPNVGSSASDIEVNADSDSGKAGPLRTIYFAFDSSALTSEAKSTLENNAEFLKDNESVEIQIEGHADERGSVQYNLALGETRARVVKNYLVALGVSSSRLSTISWGKERPLAFGHTESAWSQNRRANFVVTAK